MSAARFDLLLGEFEAWGFDTRGWGKNTRYKYAMRIRALERWLRDKANKSVLWAKPKDLKNWLFHQPADPRTRNHYAQAARAFFDFLVDREYVDVNHALALPRLPEPESVPKALTEAQARAVEKAAKLFDLRVQVLVYVLLFIALRREEARLLEWVRLDLDDGWVRFTAKGAKERVLPLHRKAAAVLERWREECPSVRWVFPSPHVPVRDRPLSASWIEDQVRAVGDEAGVKDLHPHQLRHTCATRLVRQGVDVRTIQELLGHKSLTTTQRYLRVRPVQLRAAIDGLDYEEEE